MPVTGSVQASANMLTAAVAAPASAFEIVFVADGGGDGSWPLILFLARADRRVRGIRMGRNFGQHNALLCGIRPARTIDDDLQQPVCEIAPMLAAAACISNVSVAKRA